MGAILIASPERSPDWTKVRESVLLRDNHRCVECGIWCRDFDADVHHLLPRSAGGNDEPSNLVTLCDGCHAAHHPKLAGGLARRVMEQWAVKLALWLDREGAILEASRSFGPVLRLFGLARFRDGQLPVVEAALSGQSVLVVSPTGFGKTLCFQLPAVLREGVSVVVSPLKALMGEQVSALLRLKVPSTFINSDLDVDEKRLRYELLTNRSFKLLYAAPERFFVQNKSELQVLRSIRPAFLVIDEAHCIDQWGRDFRPEYSRLREVREALGSPPVLAFTATAGVEMQERIFASLGVDNARVFVRDVDRPNISLLRWQASTTDRPKIIAQLCRLRLPTNGKVMIFVPTRKIGEALQKHLRERGLETPFYHSRLGSAWEREQLVKRFVGESQPSVDGSSAPAHSVWASTFQTCEWLFIGSTRRRSRITFRSSVERDETGGHPLPSFFIIPIPRATGATTFVFCVSWLRRPLRAHPSISEQRRSVTKFDKSKLWPAWWDRMPASDEHWSTILPDRKLPLAAASRHGYWNGFSLIEEGFGKKQLVAMLVVDA